MKYRKYIGIAFATGIFGHLLIEPPVGVVRFALTSIIVGTILGILSYRLDKELGRGN